MCNFDDWVQVIALNKMRFENQSVVFASLTDVWFIELQNKLIKLQNKFIKLMMFALISWNM